MSEANSMVRLDEEDYRILMVAVDFFGERLLSQVNKLNDDNEGKKDLLDLLSQVRTVSSKLEGSFIE